MLIFLIFFFFILLLDIFRNYVPCFSCAKPSNLGSHGCRCPHTQESAPHHGAGVNCPWLNHPQVDNHEYGCDYKNLSDLVSNCQRNNSWEEMCCSFNDPSGGGQPMTSHQLKIFPPNTILILQHGMLEPFTNLEEFIK